MANENQIDWLQTVGEDDLREVIEPIQGMSVLLGGGLHRIHDDGYSETEKHAYTALRVICDHVEEELTKMKPKLEYMDCKMREVN